MEMAVGLSSLNGLPTPQPLMNLSVDNEIDFLSGLLQPYFHLHLARQYQGAGAQGKRAYWCQNQGLKTRMKDGSSR